MTRQSLLYMIMCLVTSLSVSAQRTFRTIELERLANELTLDVQSLPEGYSHPVSNLHRLTVRVYDNIIQHIGLQLFSENIRDANDTPIFDFLERYFLQMYYPPQEKSAFLMARDDQFNFVIGSIHDVEKLRTSDDFSYNRDQYQYVATWSHEGQVLLSVSFPVEYELISGENKIEAENNIKSDIQQTPIAESPASQQAKDFSTYISKDFSNRLYTTNGRLIASTKHPAETAANIMLDTKAAIGYNLNITQVSYGLKKTTFSAPLQQWIAFCKNHGCELYFGVENMSSNGDVDAVVLAVNEAENYNHILTVHIPIESIARKQLTIEAQLYPYIPTHNVLNMFAPYRKSNPKTIVSK